MGTAPDEVGTVSVQVVAAMAMRGACRVRLLPARSYLACCLQSA